MKKPTKPYKPTKPTEPAKTWTYNMPIYVKDGQKLSDLVELCKEQLSQNDYTKHLNIININLEDIKIEKCEDWGCGEIHHTLYYSVELDKNSESYTREKEHYKKALEVFNTKNKKYQEQLKQYISDLEKYDKYKEQKEEERKKKLYEELKKEFDSSIK